MERAEEGRQLEEIAERQRLQLEERVAERSQRMHVMVGAVKQKAVVELKELIEQQKHVVHSCVWNCTGNEKGL